MFMWQGKQSTQLQWIKKSKQLFKWIIHDLDQWRRRVFEICLLTSDEAIESVIGQYLSIFFFYWVFKEFLGLGNVCDHLQTCLVKALCLDWWLHLGLIPRTRLCFSPCSASWCYTTGLLLMDVSLWHHGAKYGKISFFIGWINLCWAHRRQTLSMVAWSLF